MTEEGKRDGSMREAFGVPLATATAAAVVCVIAYVARGFLQGKLDDCNSIPGTIGRIFDEGTATNCGMVPLLFDVSRGFFYLSLVALLIMLAFTALLAYFHFSGKETIGGGAERRAAAVEEAGPRRVRVTKISDGAVRIDDMMTELPAPLVAEHIDAICSRLNDTLGLDSSAGYDHWITSTGVQGMIAFGKAARDTTQIPHDAEVGADERWWVASYTYTECPQFSVVSFRLIRATLSRGESFDRQTVDALVAELASETKTTA